MSLHTEPDLQRALARLAADQPPTEASGVLDRLHGRRRRRRIVQGTAGAALVVGAVVAGVALAASDGDGSSVVATATAPADPAAKAVAELPADADQEVYLRPDAPDTAIEAVRAALVADPRVAAFHYLDHDAAYARFVDLFEERNPQLVEFTTPASLPTSFLVLLVDDADEEAFVADARALPSVFEVTDTRHAAGPTR